MFEDDAAATGVGLRVIDHVVELLEAMGSVLFASTRGLLDCEWIPPSLPQQHPHVVVAEMFERADAFQFGQSNFHFDLVQVGAAREVVTGHPDFGVRVAEGAIEQLQFFRRDHAVLDEKFLRGAILRVVEQDNARRPTAAACATRLLVVRFERAWQGVVDHLPHVGAVNPHPEGVGRHDDGSRPVDEAFLNPRAVFGEETRVIMLGLQLAGDAHELGDFFRVAARACVDEGRAM